MSQLKKTAGRIRRKASVKVFGNVVSPKTNFLYGIYVPVCRMKFRQNGESRLSEAARRRATEFEREGTYVFPPALPKPALNSLATRADFLLAQPNKVVARADGTLVRLKGSLEEFPELEALITQDIVDTIEAYFGSYFKIYSTDIYRILPTKAKADESFLWHFDNGPTKLIKLMVYLDDVTADTGGFRVKPKPLSMKLKRQGFWDRKDIAPFKSILEDKDSTKVFEGPVGTSVLFHALSCIHKATFPEHGHRDVATFLIHPSTIPWQEHLAGNRNRLSTNFGYCVNPFTDRPMRQGEE
jgi:hypothetical protein